MSYCVNCGVELEKSLKSCPLCHCPVINPMDSGTYEHAGPAGVDLLDKTGEHRFVSVLLSVILVFAGLICLTIDLVYNSEISWSGLTLGALGLAWVFFALPLWPRRIGLRRAFAVDAAALLLFLWLLDSRLFEGQWFSTLALPIVVIVTLIFVGVASLGKNGRVQGWRLAGVILLGCGLISMGVDASVHWHAAGKIAVSWSLMVILPCAAAAAVTFVIDRKKNLQESLARRFHI